MGNALKIILYTGTGLFVLCVGFVLIVPGLMDWNQYKGQIVDRVAYELGREFAVSGDISLSVIPKTKFSLKGVHIGSIEGARVSHMAQVNSVDVMDISITKCESAAIDPIFRLRRRSNAGVSDARLDAHQDCQELVVLRGM